MMRRLRPRTIAPLAVLGVVTAMSGNAAAESLNTTASISRAAPQVRLGASLRPIRDALPGCTIYVSSTGRDASSGRDQSHPMSLLQATRIVQPGSVVCLLPGTYLTSDRIMLLRSGRPGAPITYRNYGGTALLQYVGGPLGGGVLQTNSGANWGGSHDIVIDGLTINGANRIDGGVFVTQGSHNVTIRNCVITNTGSAGIAVQASDYVTIIHNQIFHFGYSRGWSGGISIWNGGYYPVYGGSTAWYDRAPGFHTVVLDNAVGGGFDGSGRHIDGDGIIVDGSGSIPPILIMNNLSYMIGGRGIEVYRTTSPMWVVNNTSFGAGLDAYDDGGDAADFSALGAKDLYWVNNIGYGWRSLRRIPAVTFSNGYSRIVWAHNVGYNGTPRGFKSAPHHPGAYRYVNPGFKSIPAVPAVSDPWDSAPAPWNLGGSLSLASNSPFLYGGIEPTALRGLSGTLRTQMLGFEREFLGTPRSRKHRKAHR